MFYERSIFSLRDAIEEVSPGLKADENSFRDGHVAPLSYLLWMCDQIQNMNTKSPDDMAKAGRWIGWVFAHAELQGVWNNCTTRNICRDDKKLGFDKLH